MSQSPGCGEFSVPLPSTPRGTERASTVPQNAWSALSIAFEPGVRAKVFWTSGPPFCASEASPVTEPSELKPASAPQLPVPPLSRLRDPVIPPPPTNAQVLSLTIELAMCPPPPRKTSPVLTKVSRRKSKRCVLATVNSTEELLYTVLSCSSKTVPPELESTYSTPPVGAVLSRIKLRSRWAATLLTPGLVAIAPPLFAEFPCMSSANPSIRHGPSVTKIAPPRVPALLLTYAPPLLVILGADA